MRLYPQSIRARALVLVLVIFVVVVVTAVQRAEARRAHAVADAMGHLHAHALFLANRQADILGQTRLLVGALEDELASGRTPPDGCPLALSTFASIHPYFSDVVVTDAEGRVTCGVAPRRQAVSLADRDYFAVARVTQGEVIGAPVISRTTGDWIVPYVLAFRAPDGTMLGVIAAALNFEWLAQEEVYAELPPGVRIGLVDASGTPVGGTSMAHAGAGSLRGTPLLAAIREQGGSGTFEEPAGPGDRRVFAFALLLETMSGPLHAWIELPRDEITRELERVFVVEVSFIVLLAVLSLAAVWFGVELLVVRPVGAVAMAAARLSQGDQTARTGVRHGSDDIGRLAAVFDEMAHALASRNEVLRLNRSLGIINDCHRLLVQESDEHALLEGVCRILVEEGGYVLAWVGFVEHDAGRNIRPVAQAGVEQGYLERVHATWADSERGRGPVGNAVRSRLPQVNYDIEDDPRMAPWREDARRRGYRSCSAFPLASGAQVIAVLAIYSTESRAFTGDETSLLSSLADDLAAGIVSRRLRADHQRALERLERTMEATVQAVATTLELRDPYTAGHERRVSHLAVAIGRELGLGEDELRGIHLAGLVHDIGKIRIPVEILTKPTRLSDVEYRLLKEHPGAGYEILKDIDFPWPIADMVRQHHERIDGSGYPLGLAGEQILLGARILAVADVVEAMASSRPFRPALGVDVALAEVARNSGRIYDTRVVDACLRLFGEKRYVLGGEPASMEGSA